MLSSFHVRLTSLVTALLLCACATPQDERANASGSQGQQTIRSGVPLDARLISLDACSTTNPKCQYYFTQLRTALESENQVEIDGRFIELNSWLTEEPAVATLLQEAAVPIADKTDKEIQDLVSLSTVGAAAIALPLPTSALGGGAAGAALAAAAPYVPIVGMILVGSVYAGVGVKMGLEGIAEQHRWVIDNGYATTGMFHSMAIYQALENGWPMPNTNNAPSVSVLQQAQFETSVTIAEVASRQVSAIFEDLRRIVNAPAFSEAADELNENLREIDKQLRTAIDRAHTDYARCTSEARTDSDLISCGHSLHSAMAEAYQIAARAVQALLDSLSGSLHPDEAKIARRELPLLVELWLTHVDLQRCFARMELSGYSSTNSYLQQVAECVGRLKE